MAAKPIGRISVARITDDWADTQALNPRALAFEMADALRSMSQPGAPVPRDKVLVMGVASNEGGADELTWHALADYFDSFGNGDRPNRIITLRGECVPSALLLDRAWIERLTNEAVTRAEIAAGYAQALPSAPATIGAAALAPQQPFKPSGSAPVCLKIREAQQRREGEASAAEQLDALVAKLAIAEREAALLRAENTTLKAQVSQGQESSEGQRRELGDERRERVRLADQLREYAGIIEFMNPSNPLSPVEGRRVVAAWCDLTENGTLDPATERGTGVGELARRWWLDRFGEPAAIVAKHLQWAITWPSRKKGGAVARQPRQKG